MRLLIAEDDPLLGEGMQTAFKLEGYVVDWMKDGQQALLALKTQEYAACLLDLNMPKLNGLNILSTIRKAGNNTPILILTARDSRADKVLGLDSGADDYITKPFDLIELKARIRALIRRRSGSGDVFFSFHGVVLDPTSRRVTVQDKPVSLSSREYAILHDLISHQNHIRSRTDLEQSLYGWGEEVESNTVEVHIHHLRKKIGAEFIRTVRGMGYVVGVE